MNITTYIIRSVTLTDLLKSTLYYNSGSQRIYIEHFPESTSVLN